MVDITPYMDKLTEAHEAEYKTKFSNITPPKFEVATGSKFTKVIRVSTYGNSRMVHCFIDNSNGDLYKAASWKAKAKHIRGNINDANPPLMDGDFYMR